MLRKIVSSTFCLAVRRKGNFNFQYKLVDIMILDITYLMSTSMSVVNKPLYVYFIST